MMDQFNAIRIFPFLFTIAIFLLLPTVMWLVEVTRIVVITGAAMSLNLLVGTTGLISMGQGLFFGLGAYVVALGTIRFNLDYFSAALLAIALSLPLSLLVALISLRAKHLFFGLLTMAIGQVAFVFVSRNYKLTGGDDGLVGIVIPEWLDNNITQHYLAVLALFITGIFLLRLLASPLGATFSAVRDNPDRVASLGSNPKLFEITAMMIGGVLAAIFGTILAATEGSVEPNLFSWVTSTMFLMMVALGGRSIFLGPLIGAVILEITRAYIQSKSANADLVVGLVVIACAVLFPEGLGLQFKKLMSRIKNFDLAKTKGGDSV